MFLQTVSIFMHIICLGRGEQLWKEVAVAELHFQGNSQMMLSTSSLNRHHCGMSCDHNPECSTWCHDGQTCLLTKLWVSPAHMTMTSSTKTCYTSLEKDYIVNSMVTFSPIDQFYPTRTPLNLLSGVYDSVGIRTCGGCAADTNYPWVLFDFFEVKTIREVRIMTQPFDYDPDLPTAAQVKIGKSPPTTEGDFSDFKYFGELPNSVQHLTTYVVKLEGPLKGCYLSIQKPEALSKWTLCYVMAL